MTSLRPPRLKEATGEAVLGFLRHPPAGQIAGQLAALSQASDHMIRCKLAGALWRPNALAEEALLIVPVPNPHPALAYLRNEPRVAPFETGGQHSPRIYEDASN